MKRLLATLVLFAALGASAFAKEILIGVPGAISHKDPLDLSYLEEWEVYAGVYETLLQYDSGGDYIGLLAERWKYDSEKKTFTFYLREDAKFSDGSPITSGDVAFSFNRLLYFDKDGSQILSRCLGGKRPESVEARHRSIQTPMTHVLVLGPLKCKEALLNELSNANYGVVPRKGLGADFKVKPGSAASGLFSYRILNGEFILVPNTYNWRWTNRSFYSFRSRIIKT